VRLTCPSISSVTRTQKPPTPKSWNKFWEDFQDEYLSDRPDYIAKTFKPMWSRRFTTEKDMVRNVSPGDRRKSRVSYQHVNCTLGHYYMSSFLPKV
jgi:hypothetical protein